MATDPTQIGIRAKPVAFSQQGTAVKLIDLESWGNGCTSMLPHGTRPFGRAGEVPFPQCLGPIRT